jgi:hypothetical protein
MSRRFEGAITTPDEPGDSTLPPPPERPRRPALIELAAAILIVGGVTAIVGTVASVADTGAGPSGSVLALVLGIDILTVVVGLLVRRGTAWIVCVNVVAVLVFLELTAIPSGSAIVLVQALLDGLVLYALIRHRGWFDWKPPEASYAR